jgi:hypothetical protein
MINKKFWEELIAYFPLIRHGSHSKGKNKGDTQTDRRTDREQTKGASFYFLKIGKQTKKGKFVLVH